MNYRIKITTYANGRQQFLAQKKVIGKWLGIECDGSLSLLSFLDNDRKSALERIDLNYTGNTTVQTIEFEYINKQLP